MDHVTSFLVPGLGIRGRFVRLRHTFDTAMSSHAYPSTVQCALGRAAALGVGFASLLKGNQKLSLQTQTDGCLRQLIVQVFSLPQGYFGVRGYARFDPTLLPPDGSFSESILLGTGHMALTIEPNGQAERYQGVVSLSEGLETACQRYFLESEQIPTRILLAHAPTSSATDFPVVAAFFIQKMTHFGGHAPIDLSYDPLIFEQRWEEALALVNTLTEEELLSTTLDSGTLLHRLFGLSGAATYQTTAVMAHCTCSRQGLLQLLQNFSLKERTAMLEDSAIRVTCEFCSQRYMFSLEETSR